MKTTRDVLPERNRSAQNPRTRPTYAEAAKEYSKKELQIRDPTTLLLVDEADRLRIASLEQVRAIFDTGEIGVILIGTPGLEKDWHGFRSSRHWSIANKVMIAPVIQQPVR